MSLQPTRQRRTFPLDALGRDDAAHSSSLTEEMSLRSSGNASMDSSSIPMVSSISSISSRSEHTAIHSTASAGALRKSKRSAEFRQPRRTASLNSNSSSRASRTPSKSRSINSKTEAEASSSSLCLDELKKSFSLGNDNLHSPSQLSQSYNQHHQQSANTPHTPSSSKVRSLTIGNSSSLSSSRSMLHTSLAPGSSKPTSSAVLPDLFGLEQAFQDAKDEDFSEGLDQIMARQMQWHGNRRGSNGSKHSRLSSGSSRTKTPVAWKTPFEVDLPRDTPVGRLLTDSVSEDGFPALGRLNEHLTVEQDAWAGIDALLDNQSVDGSCAISTTDILPRAIVRAMKRDLSRSSIEESLAPDDDQILESKKGIREQKLGMPIGSSLPSLAEIGSSVDFGETLDQVGELPTPRREQPRRGVGTTGSGGLFDVFHWSEKDNVDESRQRKKKLNQPHKNRVKIKTNSSHSTKGGKRNSGSDDSSLPSLSSFQDDEMVSRSSRSQASDWEGFGGGGVQFDTKVSPIKEEVIEAGGDEFFGGGVKFGVTFVVEEKGEENDSDEASSDHESGDGGLDEDEGPGFEGGDDSADSGADFKNDGLVLDEGVDRYIQEIQAQLPLAKNSTIPIHTILERPSPTSVAEDELSAAQELPTLASLASGSSSNASRQAESSSDGKKGQGKSNRRNEKKDVKLSLSYQLKNSIKKIREKKGKPSKAPGRSEEKYFPEEVVGPAPKKFSAKRSLLTQGDDGVNWD